MHVFEQMWKELVERILLAQKYSLNQTITYQDTLNLMAAYEQRFEEEIKAVQDEGVARAIEQYKKDTETKKDE